MNDFSATTVRRLRARGIRLLGLTVVPGPGPLPFASGSRGYVLDDNGTQVVRAFAEVLALAT